MTGKQLLIDTTTIPSWVKEREDSIRGHQFDGLIASSGKHISEQTFRKEFLPLFAANNEIPDEAYDSFIKRWIFYAQQPYNALEVYRTVDQNGNGTDLLFIVPPLWNGKAPILKDAAAKPMKDDQGNVYEKDPSIFRTLVARINQYITAQDHLQLVKHRDQILPMMVAEKAAIEIDDLVKWKYIFDIYKIDNEASKSINRLLAGENIESSVESNTEASSATIVTGADEL